MRHLALRRSLHVALLAPTFAPSQYARGEGPVEQCGYGDWSEPTSVEEGRVLVEPELAGDIVIGNDVPTLEIPTDRAAFVAWRMPNENIGTPGNPNKFLIVYPKAAMSPDGTLHMVWAEPDDPPDDDRWGDFTHKSLWYSAYRPDGWTEPLELLRRDELWWGLHDRTLAIDATGQVHVIVSARTPPNADVPFETLHLVGNRAGWQVNRLMPRRVSYPAITVAQSGRLHIAFIGAAGTGNPNSVFLLASEDGGQSWTEPKQVYTSGGRQAFDLEALYSANDQLHLIWRDDNSGVLRHIASVDEGRSWSGFSEIPLHGQLISRAAVADQCGAIHVVSTAMTPDEQGQAPLGLWYVRWQNGWTVPENLFASMQQALNPALGLDAQGSPMLYLTGSYDAGSRAGQVGGVTSRLDVQR